MDVYFHEEQRFRQVWIWALLVPAFAAGVATAGYGMVKQLWFGIPWGNQPMPDKALWIFGPMVILILGLSPITIPPIPMLSRGKVAPRGPP